MLSPPEKSVVDNHVDDVFCGSAPVTFDAFSSALYAAVFTLPFVWLMTAK